MKMHDLGSFTIPCIIGTTELGNALCDLGASIKLSLGELTPIVVTLQMTVNQWCSLKEFWKMYSSR